MLPKCIRDRESAKSAWVLLLDAQVNPFVAVPVRVLMTFFQIATGSSALMAIRVLLDHGVRQDRIIFITFLVAKDKGVAAIETAFPRIRIITGAVDSELYECWMADDAEDYEEKIRTWVIHPGMGQVGESFWTDLYVLFD
jgi:uridine kinase